MKLRFGVWPCRPGPRRSYCGYSQRVSVVPRPRKHQWNGNDGEHERSDNEGDHFDVILNPVGHREEHQSHAGKTDQLDERTSHLIRDKRRAAIFSMKRK